jgi:hypothetical protein
MKTIQNLKNSIEKNTFNAIMEESKKDEPG